MSKPIDPKLAADIFGEFDFVTTADIAGKRIMVEDFEMVDVKGYDKPAMKISIVVDGRSTYWSSFSEQVQDQVNKAKKAGLLPYEFGVATGASKKRGYSNWVKLTK